MESTLLINRFKKSLKINCESCKKKFNHLYDFDEEAFDAFGLSFNRAQYFICCPYCDSVRRLRIDVELRNNCYRAEYCK